MLFYCSNFFFYFITFLGSCLFIIYIFFIYIIKK